jgi:hypothetical protein
VRLSVTGSMGHARCKKMKRLPRGADELRRGPQTGKSRAINIMAISSVDDSLQVSRNRNAVVTCCGSFCFQESGHNCGTAGSRHAGLLDWGGASVSELASATSSPPQAIRHGPLYLFSIRTS